MITKTATAIGALMLATSSFAMAQSPTTPTPSTPPPAVKPVPDATAPAPTVRTPSGDLSWYSHDANEVRASKLIGTKVVNAANENVGNINEVILSKDGDVAAVVIGVGGFLGIGEREVAVKFDSIKMARDQNNNLVLTINATRDSLKEAPAWTWKQAMR